MAATALAFLPFSLKAQTGNAPESGYALRITDLTSQDRDELQSALEGRSDLRLVFACVPAGVLVFEAAHGEPKQLVMRRTLPLLDAKALRSRTTELPGGRAEAEALCVNARNR